MTKRTASGLGLLLLVFVLGVLIATDAPVGRGLVALICTAALALGLLQLARRSRAE